jgi:drug/metabolite transporter (DMT)-like permease
MTSARRALAADRAQRLAFAALILANICLAIGPLLVRMADCGPVSAAFWRVVLALPIVVLLARRFGGLAVPRGRSLALILFGGTCFGVDLGLWHLGIMHTAVANASLLGNISSLLLPLWGALVLRQWQGRWQGIALPLALGGVALLGGSSVELSRERLIGDLMSIGAGIFYTAYIIALQRARDAMGSWLVLALSGLASAPVLLAGGLLLGEPVWPHRWWPVVALMVTSQLLGQGLLVWSIAYVTPLVVGVLLLLQPVISVGLAAALFGERPGPLDGAGLALIAVSLVLVRFEPAPRLAAAPQARREER